MYINNNVNLIYIFKYIVKYFIISMIFVLTSYQSLIAFNRIYSYLSPTTLVTMSKQ